MNTPVRCVLAASMVVVLGSCAGTPSASPPTSPGLSEAETIKPLAELNLDERGRALRGYDPVAYFKDQQAVEGKEEFKLSWEGADWYFSSAQNLDEFSQSPEKYAPSNGGFCTFGIVLSKKFDGDPEVWSIVENQLHVFLNEEVKEKFLQDTVGNLELVSSNWPKIKNKSPEEL